MVYQQSVRVHELVYCRDSAPCFICQSSSSAPRPAIKMVMGSKVQAERLVDIYRSAGLTVEMDYYAHKPSRVEVIASACVHHLSDLGKLKDAIESGENLVTAQQMRGLERIVQEKNIQPNDI
ncbi:hypothetical protein J4417_05000 [Candidatus Woesearchaeota archaeon]|nr:hypothetical protein [Candidatus Woesearchaeota archaeon]